MALSRNVRYQFVCAKRFVFPLFAGWFPVAPRLPAAEMGSVREPEQVPPGLEFTGHHTFTQA